MFKQEERDIAQGEFGIHRLINFIQLLFISAPHHVFRFDILVFTLEIFIAIATKKLSASKRRIENRLQTIAVKIKNQRSLNINESVLIAPVICLVLPPVSDNHFVKIE